MILYVYHVKLCEQETTFAHSSLRRMQNSQEMLQISLIFNNNALLFLVVGCCQRG